MYLIIQITDSCTIVDSTSKKSRSLDKEEVALIKTLFPKLADNNAGILQAIEIVSAQMNKLSKPQLKGDVYLVNGIGGLYTVYDSKTDIAKEISKEEVMLFKSLVPALLKTKTAIFHSVEVSQAPLNKLTKLSLPVQQTQPASLTINK